MTRELSYWPQHVVAENPSFASEPRVGNITFRGRASRPCRRPKLVSGGRKGLVIFLVGRFFQCSYGGGITACLCLLCQTGLKSSFRDFCVSPSEPAQNSVQETVQQNCCVCQSHILNENSISSCELALHGRLCMDSRTLLPLRPYTD